jgi:hypothetical protein
MTIIVSFDFFDSGSLHALILFAEENVVDILLSVGPDSLARAWEYRSDEVLDDGLGFGLYEDDGENPLYKGYFSLPLENIWTARKVKPPKDDEPATKWVLDTINGANDTCESFE